MTIEDRLKDLILSRYKSIREFVAHTDIPYSTVDGILKRGVMNAGLKNIFKICDALEISVEELYEDKIVPKDKTIQRRLQITEINDIVAFTRRNLNEYTDLTLNGKPLTKEDIESLMDAIELCVEFIRRRKENEK